MHPYLLANVYKEGRAAIKSMDIKNVECQEQKRRLRKCVLKKVRQMKDENHRQPRCCPMAQTVDAP